jgi:hypothetical protein
MNKSFKKYTGGKFFGKGGSGIILGNPRAPFLQKYDLMNVKLENISKNNNKENTETVEELIQNKYTLNQVSKFFYKEMSFFNEAKQYIYILKEIFSNFSKEDINKYFNLPLNLGIINKDLMCNLKYNSIYNNSWIGDLNNNTTFREKLDFYSIYQITFELGKSIIDISLELFFKKYINILESVKLLNTNNLIFDDLKLDNIILVNNFIKNSDFSSIYNFNEINSNSILQTNLHHPFYVIYNPVLIMILKYYLYKKQNKNISLLDLYEEILELKKKTEKYVIEFNEDIKDRFTLIINNTNKNMQLNFVDNIYEITKNDLINSQNLIHFIKIIQT